MADIAAPPSRIGTGETLSSLDVLGDSSLQGSLTVDGAFTSPGIDDNATTTQVTISDTTTTFAGDLSVTGMVNLGTPTELTISSGAITVTKSYHGVDTEADAATDDLDTINGGTDGDRLLLKAQNDARTVVLKDNVGNLRLNGDCSLDSVVDSIELIYLVNVWVEISRSNNG